MEPREFTVVDPDGVTVVVFEWLPSTRPRAAIHVMHGLGEHARRYDRLASALTGAGYAVYADDHRGHGQTGLRNGGLGAMGPGGQDGVVESVHAVTARAASLDPTLPVYALGHSWGSFILYRYLQLFGAELAGAMLTGTTRRDPNAPRPAGTMAERNAFEGRTAYDWLTRDQAEVDLYIADPMCGFEAVRRRDESGSAVPSAPERPRPQGDETTIPKDLPIFVFNGGADPVGGEAGGRALVEHLQSLGMRDVQFNVYPGAPRIVQRALPRRGDNRRARVARQTRADVGL